LKKHVGLTDEALNDASNYAVQTLLTRLKREAKQEGDNKKIGS